MNVVVSQDSGRDGNDERGGAGAIENMQTAKRSSVEPCMQEWHTAWPLREDAVNHDLERPGTEYSESRIHNHRQASPKQWLAERTQQRQKVLHPDPHRVVL